MGAVQITGRRTLSKSLLCTAECFELGGYGTGRCSRRRQFVRCALDGKKNLVSSSRFKWFL